MELIRDGNYVLQLMVENFNLETQEEIQCVDNHEKKLKEVFTNILNSAQVVVRKTKE